MCRCFFCSSRIRFSKSSCSKRAWRSCLRFLFFISLLVLFSFSTTKKSLYRPCARENDEMVSATRGALEWGNEFLFFGGCTFFSPSFSSFLLSLFSSRAGVVSINNATHTYLYIQTIRRRHLLRRRNASVAICASLWLRCYQLLLFYKNVFMYTTSAARYCLVLSLARATLFLDDGALEGLLQNDVRGKGEDGE